MVARLLVGGYLYFHLRPHSDDLLSPGSVASRLVGLQDALGQVGYVSNLGSYRVPSGTSTVGVPPSSPPSGHHRLLSPRPCRICVLSCVPLATSPIMFCFLYISPSARGRFKPFCRLASDPPLLQVLSNIHPQLINVG